MSNCIALDIGTETIRIAEQESGRVVSEANLLAVSAENGMVYEYGCAAQEVMERVPGRYIGVRPVEKGVIADYNMLQILLTELIRKRRRFFTQPKAVVAVPAGITAMQKREFEDAIRSAGVREVMLMDAPAAAALGMGEKIAGTRAIMVVSIGAGVTEVAVICMERTVGYKMLQIAGNVMNEAVAQKIRSTLGLWIGGSVTEHLKRKFGLVGGELETVCGKNIATGLPMMGSISGTELARAMEQPAASIADAVREVLCTLPEELYRDIEANGILLTGGGAKLLGLGAFLQTALGIATRTAAHPENAVINGVLRAVGELEKMPRRSQAADAQNDEVSAFSAQCAECRSK